LVGSAEFFDVSGYDLFRTIAKRHHTEDTGNSNENAKNRQARTHPILRKMRYP
jgi:hypothetical protein